MRLHFTSMSGLEILFEDEDLFLLNKPRAIHSISRSAADHSIVTKLLNIDSILDSEQAALSDAGLIQRLDFFTSGCLLGAKNEKTWQNLKQQIKTGLIRKQYLAILERNLTDCSVFAFIGSPYRHAKKVKCYLPANSISRSLSARTEFSSGIQAGSNCYLLEACALTGRRHQIRAHASFVGAPLVGDKIYGSSLELNEELAFLQNKDIDGFFLHAKGISFSHPKKQQPLSFVAKLPEDFSELSQLSLR